MKKRNLEIPIADVRTNLSSIICANRVSLSLILKKNVSLFSHTRWQNSEWKMCKNSGGVETIIVIPSPAL